MTKILTLLLVLSLGITTAQETSKRIKKPKTTVAKIEGAGIVFESEVIDYGTIAHNSNGKREFTFTNNGKAPLIILNTQGSCGCTVPTSPKEPIMPGSKGVIGVNYATNIVGPFIKTITIFSNAVNQTTKVLTIKGTVLAEEIKS